MTLFYTDNKISPRVLYCAPRISRWIGLESNKVTDTVFDGYGNIEFACFVVKPISIIKVTLACVIVYIFFFFM